MIDVFVIDPPWPKKKGGKKAVRPISSGGFVPYGTMPVGEIFRLLDCQVLSMAAGQHCVFLWTVDQFLHESEARMLERGYRLHARIIWDKVTGIPAAFTIRYAHEYLLWFYKPHLLPICKEQRGKFKTVLVEQCRQHSRKPDVAYNMVAALYPSATKMDVFSREPRRDWLQWGDQCDYFPQCG